MLSKLQINRSMTVKKIYISIKEIPDFRSHLEHQNLYFLINFIFYKM